ncbi:MAG TPA: DUF58 domain-containing protein [Dehalococcoidia bacterium]|nr:DUF58 domain-containing protein [Dehalococcoidia bacterium]
MRLLPFRGGRRPSRHASTRLGSVSPEVLRAVRRIQIRANRLLSNRFLGEYHSVFKGHGIEFQETREYQPGDDERTIDWNVTARTGVPHVKKYVEERELVVLLLVDVSASLNFGSVHRTKRDVAAEIAAVLALAATRNNDRVGLIAFTDRIEYYLPPRKGTQHVLRLVRELLQLEPAGSGTDLAAALRFLNKVQRRRAVVFVLSDFMATGYEPALRVSALRHDVTALSLADPRELELPPVGLIELEDAESGRLVLVDASEAETRRQYRIAAIRDFEERQRTFRTIGIDEVALRTDRPYLPLLLQHFNLRARRF